MSAGFPWRGGPARWVPWPLVLAAVLAAGCGVTTSPPVEGPGPDEAGAELQPERLPSTLPTDVDNVVLPTVPVPADAPADGDVVPEPIAGYTGTQWLTDATGEVAVVPESISVRRGIVRGLVRNGRTVPVGPVEVSLGQRSTVVPLPSLRPGEPAPFELPAGTSLAVDEVIAALDVRAPETSATAVRGLRLGVFWQRASDEGSVGTYLLPASELDGPTTVAFGTATAAEAVSDLQVVAAWLDHAGAVVAVDPAGLVQFPALGPGATTDLVVRTDGLLDGDVTLVLWGTGQ